MTNALFTTRLRVIALIGTLGWNPGSGAALKIIASTTDLAALAAEVGGPEVSADSFAKGTQDPHHIEAKPSFMVRAASADLIVANGLDLEVGWLPNIVKGSRNPRILPGSPGYIELGASVPVLEKQEGRLSRCEGDVHPEGNPHVTLDPIRMGAMARALAVRLSELDAGHAKGYASRAEALAKRMEGKAEGWKARIQATGIKEVITYHKMLTYFLDRFGVANSVFLEPKPGIPPTASHLIDVVNKARERKISLVLVENYFDLRGAERVAEEVKGLRVESVAVSVGGLPNVKTIDDLFEAIVVSFEKKK